MLKEPCLEKRQEQRFFQSVYLSNRKDQEVMVIEDDHIDFEEVQKRLNNGESVFSTSKNSQKLLLDNPDKHRSPIYCKVYKRTLPFRNENKNQTSEVE